VLKATNGKQWVARFVAELGVRLVQENDLAKVRVLSKRFDEVDRHMPFIAIMPIAKG